MTTWSISLYQRMCRAVTAVMPIIYKYLFHHAFISVPWSCGVALWHRNTAASSEHRQLTYKSLNRYKGRASHIANTSRRPRQWQGGSAATITLKIHVAVKEGDNNYKKREPVAASAAWSYPHPPLNWRVWCTLGRVNPNPIPNSILSDCLHGLLPGPFLLSYSVFSFSIFYFFVSVTRAGLSWPSRQLLRARKYAISYRIVSYRSPNHNPVPNLSLICIILWCHQYGPKTPKTRFWQIFQFRGQPLPSPTESNLRERVDSWCVVPRQFLPCPVYIGETPPKNRDLYRATLS